MGLPWSRRRSNFRISSCIAGRQTGTKWYRFCKYSWRCLAAHSCRYRCVARRRWSGTYCRILRERWKSFKELCRSLIKSCLAFLRTHPLYNDARKNAQSLLFDTSCLRNLQVLLNFSCFFQLKVVRVPGKLKRQMQLFVISDHWSEPESVCVASIASLQVSQKLRMTLGARCYTQFKYWNTRTLDLKSKSDECFWLLLHFKNEGFIFTRYLTFSMC